VIAPPISPPNAFPSPERVLGNYFLFERDGEFAMFDPMSLKTIYLSFDEKQILFGSSGSDESRNKLLRFLSAEGFSESPKSSLRHRLLQQFDPNIARPETDALRLSGLRIVLTRKCNMTCSYCFVATNNGSADMTEDELEEGLTFLFEQNRDQQTVWIQWFGGEPTIRFDLITKGDVIIDRLQDIYGVGEVIRTLVTNGLNITDDQLTYLESHRYGVGVSLDGVPQVNELSRLMLSGASADTKILKNLQRFRSHDIRLGINYTPTASSLLALPDFVDYCQRQLGVDFVYVNFPIPTEGKWPVEGSALAEALFEARRRAMLNGGFLYSGIDRVIGAINSRLPRVYDHEESFGGIIGALLPGSRVSLSEINFESSEFVLDLRRLRKEPSLLKQVIKDIVPSRKCDECAAISVCGGPQKNDQILQKTVEPDEQFCSFCIASLSRALWNETQL
jgi:uncharacterized protein